MRVKPALLCSPPQRQFRIRRPIAAQPPSCAISRSRWTARIFCEPKPSCAGAVFRSPSKITRSLTRFISTTPTDTRSSSPRTSWMRRRRFISILGAACLRAQTPPSSKDDWPQFRGNPQLTGVAASFLPATLKLVWTYEAGDSIESSAAILSGAVYVGSMAAGLISLDLQTGKLRWKYPVQDGIEESSPTVRDGIVYVGDLSGVLHAVNAQDGKSLWTLRTGAEIKSSPVVVGDRLLVGSYDGNLYCVAARTGAVHWIFPTTNYVHCTPGVSA